MVVVVVVRFRPRGLIERGGGERNGGIEGELKV
jgi:hypothetical protein